MLGHRSKVTAAEHERTVEGLRSVIEELRGELAEVRRREAEPSEWLERVKARKILVHQKNDQSIEGLLVANLRDGIALRSAHMLRSGAEPIPMGGEVFIPREQIGLVQFDG